MPLSLTERIGMEIRSLMILSYVLSFLQLLYSNFRIQIYAAVMILYSLSCSSSESWDLRSWEITGYQREPMASIPGSDWHTNNALFFFPA